MFWAIHWPRGFWLFLSCWVGGHTVSAATTVQLSPAVDATLYENAAGSFANGQGPGIFTGVTAGGLKRRTVMRFDFSALPSGITVTHAAVLLHVTRSPGSTSDIAFHRLLAGWTEGPSNAGASRDGLGVSSQTGDVTWLHSSKGTSVWTTPGGDFLATASDVYEFFGTGSRSMDGLLADLHVWLQNPAINYGWILLGDETQNSGTALRLGSTEAAAELRPVLTLTYELNPVPEPSRVIVLALGVLALLLFHRRRIRSESAAWI